MAAKIDSDVFSFTRLLIFRDGLFFDCCRLISFQPPQSGAKEESDKKFSYQLKEKL